MLDSSEVVYTLPLDIQQTDSVFTGLSGGLYDIVVADEMGWQTPFHLKYPNPSLGCFARRGCGIP